MVVVAVAVAVAVAVGVGVGAGAGLGVGVGVGAGAGLGVGVVVVVVVVAAAAAVALALAAEARWSARLLGEVCRGTISAGELRPLLSELYLWTGTPVFEDMVGEEAASTQCQAGVLPLLRSCFRGLDL